VRRHLRQQTPGLPSARGNPVRHVGADFSPCTCRRLSRCGAPSDKAAGAAQPARGRRGDAEPLTCPPCTRHRAFLAMCQAYGPSGSVRLRAGVLVGGKVASPHRKIPLAHPRMRCGLAHAVIPTVYRVGNGEGPLPTLTVTPVTLSPAMTGEPLAPVIGIAGPRT